MPGALGSLSAGPAGGHIFFRHPGVHHCSLYLQCDREEPRRLSRYVLLDVPSCKSFNLADITFRMEKPLLTLRSYRISTRGPFVAPPRPPLPIASTADNGTNPPNHTTAARRTSLLPFSPTASNTDHTYDTYGREGGAKNA
ncbi:hypothetical protein DOTSEDRAFT_39655 [Dothistroma septosporum NZE10]|uniref:Uncharacterized protein n=1 Tax=Dothistroma septosporum (strain NZE10 / CBS 128990) TaxID=675120 RepID=M2XGC4_DOTSN|nr:hypothetical protein DOTSEDRAFT_39655 [Dothistroma septosporum NZE10]